MVGPQAFAPCKRDSIGAGVIGFSTRWQRYPGQFVLGLAALTVGGLVAMLSDATLWKAVGFVLSSFHTRGCVCLPQSVAEATSLAADALVRERAAAWGGMQPTRFRGAIVGKPTSPTQSTPIQEAMPLAGISVLVRHTGFCIELRPNASY